MSISIKNRILLPSLILCLVSLCLVSCEVLGLDHLPTSTQDVSVTVSPTPPAVYSFPLQPLSGEVTNFATYETNIEDIPPGTYMLANNIYYYSLEGLRLGKLLNLTTAEPSFSDYWHDFILVGDPQSPILYRIYANNSGSKKDDSGQILVQKLDIKSGETSAWQVDLNEPLRAIHQMGKIRCEHPYLSPSGRWLAGECEVYTERYIYILDQKTLSGRLLRTPPGSCQAEQISKASWWFEDWSPDEAWLFTRCRARGCLISMEGGEFTCREPFDVGFYGWSPDGSKVALTNISSNDQEDAGTQLHVTNTACLIDENACESYISFDIYSYIWTVIWDSTGSSLIWAEYPLVGTESGWIAGFSKIGIADVTTGETSLITDEAPKGLYVVEFSPDNQWLILHDDQGGIWKFILESKSFRRLFQEPDTSYYDFFGWMEIP